MRHCRLKMGGAVIWSCFGIPPKELHNSSELETRAAIKMAEVCGVEVDQFELDQYFTGTKSATIYLFQKVS